MRLWLIALLLVASSSAAAGDSTQKLAVLPMVGVGVEERVAKVLTDIITFEVGRSRRYQVISADEVNAMIGLERMKDVAGCDNSVCAAEIGGALGADLMLTGNVGRLGSSLTIKLTLFDTGNMTVLARSLERTGNDEDLYEQAAIAALDQLVGPRANAAPLGAWEPATDDKIIVTFESDPPGAVVWVDGLLLCQSTAAPCRRALIEGEHTVAMQMEGYSKKVERLRVRDGTALRWSLSPTFGTASFRTEPAGAVVFIDEHRVGETPIEELRLAPGTHEVELHHECHHRVSRPLEITRAHRARIDERLLPREGAVEVLAVDAEGNAVDAAIWVDGREVGRAPGTVKASICAQRLQVRHAEFDNWSAALRVREREVKQIRVELTDVETATARRLAAEEAARVERAELEQRLVATEAKPNVEAALSYLFDHRDRLGVGHGIALDFVIQPMVFLDRRLHLGAFVHATFYGADQVTGKRDSHVKLGGFVGYTHYGESFAPFVRLESGWQHTSNTEVTPLSLGATVGAKYYLDPEFHLVMAGGVDRELSPRFFIGLGTNSLYLLAVMLAMGG